MLKLSIFLPNEFIENVPSLEDFISDLGDILVKHEYGNEILMEDPDKSYMDDMLSYIIISDEKNDELENLENAFLVIPVKDEK